MRALVLLLAGCGFGTGTPEQIDPANLPEVVTWEQHVGPMLAVYCTGCHGASYAADGVQLNTYRGARCEFGEIREVLGSGEMPPGAARQPDAWETATLLKWREDGYPLSVDADGYVVDGEPCGGGG